MAHVTIRPVALVVLLAGIFIAAVAPAVPIVFQVHMSQQIALGNFDPSADFVDLAGSFNDWGGNPLLPLADADGDTVYSVTVDGFTPTDVIEFKFRYNGQWDGTEEFPGIGNNRFYTVLADSNLIDVWYNVLAPDNSPVVVGPVHWWNDTVFYEIFVRSFSDSDGDGIGDLVGLTRKLDYLNDGDPATDSDLGITGIWLMPINDSPSYHGYDSVDYRAINPDYGTMADFEAFLAAAHARGIKVIVDYVMNHCSDQHPWFLAAEQNDPQYRDYFRWSPNDPGETGPWGQNVWHPNASGYYYGLFGGGMPDLNYDTPAVKDAMFATAAAWLDTIGVDGFRLDAVLYIDENPGQLMNTPETLQFWQDFNTHIKAVKPEAMTVGEAWTGSNTVVQYVTDNRLDLCFEFDLSYAMLNAVNNADAGQAGFKAAQVYNLYPYLQFATFLTNHDQDRSFNVLGFDLGKAKAAAGLYLTLPGVPFLYYGEEIGMIGSGDDRFKRSPMQWTDEPGAGFTTGTPWQAINDNAPQYNVQVEDQDSQSLLNWYRRLIQVRNQAPALRRGTYTALTSSSSSVLAFLRSEGPQTLLCLVNLSPYTKSGVTLTGTMDSLTPGTLPMVDLLNPLDTRTVTITPAYQITDLDLGSYAVRVYEFDGMSGVESPPADLPGMGLKLEQNVPNPFNPSTSIGYFLPDRTHVRLGVYDLAGREVATILDSVQPQGKQEARWDGLDRQGQPLGSGVYVMRLDAGGETRLSKMLLLK